MYMDTKFKQYLTISLGYYRISFKEEIWLTQKKF